MSDTVLNTLFPEIEPYHKDFLDIGDGYSMYYEESGNPQGKPVLFVHGGPGGGTAPNQRRFWDPKAYRIILFDQRGCGHTKPHACLEKNTTWDLVKDMEKLRNHLDIKRWQVFGGSWGSTLALSYASLHADKITELILRGIFLLRKKELSFFYQDGASRIYPDAFDQYLDFIPEKEQDDLMAAYRKRLTSENQELRLEAAKRWSIWEGSTSYLYQDKGAINKSGADDFALAFARIENHYFVNEGFFDYDGYILDQVEKFRNIPSVIVQGRYDVVCPMDTAWALHKKWPEADFNIVQDAGHSANEPGIQHQLILATERFKNHEN